MQIVIEYVFLENFLVNLVLLKTTALLSKNKGRLFILTAFLGACFNVVLPLFRLSGVGHFLVQTGIVTISVCLSFKFKKFKAFLMLFLAFFASSFVYGGACYYFESLFGLPALLIVMATVVAMFLAIKFLFKIFNRKKAVDNFCFDVEIENNGKKAQFKAFLDSGNMLFDPLTQSPVNLVNFKVFSSLFSEVGIEDLLRKTDKLKTLTNAHYINLGTLSGNEKILVFQVDNLRAGEKTLPKATVGLCFKNFNAAFESDIILHNNFAMS